ncbi:glycerol dehydrogenase [Aerococcus agrisoli]|nr:glycerol dehydrogenase [Aerococcus agrisoli]
MKKVFISPAKYIQGAGVLATIGEEVGKMGNKAFIMADKIVWGIAGELVEKSFKDAGVDYHYEEFTGEASKGEIERIANIGKDLNVDVVVGLGGGKTLDTAKAVNDALGTKIVVAPTTASTDAPTSSLSVIYSDEGVFEGYKFYNKNPDLVLVDSQIIVGAPAFLFASGMGDAMATLVEAKASQKRNATTMAGGKATLAGTAIAEKAEEILFEQGIAAYKAVEQHLVTPQVEAIIEANTLLSGLGFENGGVAAAHAVHNGFTALTGDIHHLTHGQKVAYGVLVQLVLESRSEEEILKYANFFKAIGLPTTLADIHLENASFEDLVKVGELATSEGETLQNFDPEVTATDVAYAIQAVDALTSK